MNSAVNYQELERTHILCTARELIGHAGWQELRLEALLQHAGVRDSSFHRHFSCMDGLLDALLADELRSAATQLWHAAAQSERPAERIRSYTATLIDHVYPMERWSRITVLASIWLNRSGHRGEQIDALANDLIEPLREAIHVGCQAGEMSSPSPDDDAQSIFHLATGMIVTQASLGRHVSPESLTVMVMDAVAHALRFTEP